MSRLASDVAWYEDENEDVKLTEDGFCKKCHEYHSVCFCEYFWIRRSSQSLFYLKEYMNKAKELQSKVAESEKSLKENSKLEAKITSAENSLLELAEYVTKTEVKLDPPTTLIMILKVLKDLR